MGLVNKLKNILFEEEEVEIPVIEKKEMVKSEPVVKQMPRQEEVVSVPDYSNFYNENTIKPLPQKEVMVEAPKEKEIVTNVEQVSEREIFKSEKTFNFPAFDEEEFESALPRRTTNVMEHERKKFRDKSARKVEMPKKEEVKEDKTKFRPSPIISPVYGILDKNYTPDDITTRECMPKTLDVDSVRKKAFGVLSDDVIDTPAPIFTDRNNDKDFLEEKLEKARTIDELLKDSSDEIIDVEESFSDKSYIDDFSNMNLEDTLTNLNVAMENENIDDNLDATIESLEEEVPTTKQQDIPIEEEDSLESDLFDLIDSMYENREDGE